MKKKVLLTVMLILFPIFVLSQTLNVHKNDGNIIEIQLANIDSITFKTYGTTCPGIPTVLYEGKTYHTVQIGSQCWLRENLDVGERIQLGAMTDNGILEKYCYDNDTTNCERYGGLYQWDEAMQYFTEEGAQGICPNGWHIPTISELQILSDAVIGDANSLKAIGEGAGEGAGTNTSGFTGLLAGAAGNIFANLNIHANFWSSTEADNSITNFLGFNNNTSSSSFLTWEKSIGFSVRCLKD